MNLYTRLSDEQKIALIREIVTAIKSDAIFDEINIESLGALQNKLHALIERAQASGFGAAVVNVAEFSGAEQTTIRTVLTALSEFERDVRTVNPLDDVNIIEHDKNNRNFYTIAEDALQAISVVADQYRSREVVARESGELFAKGAGHQFAAIGQTLRGLYDLTVSALANAFGFAKGTTGEAFEHTGNVVNATVDATRKGSKDTYKRLTVEADLASREAIQGIREKLGLAKRAERIKKSELRDEMGDATLALFREGKDASFANLDTYFQDKHGMTVTAFIAALDEEAQKALLGPIFDKDLQGGLSARTEALIEAINKGAVALYNDSTGTVAREFSAAMEHTGEHGEKALKALSHTFDVADDRVRAQSAASREAIAKGVRTIAEANQWEARLDKALAQLAANANDGLGLDEGRAA